MLSPNPNSSRTVKRATTGARTVWENKISVQYSFFSLSRFSFFVVVVAAGVNSSASGRCTAGVCLGKAPYRSARYFWFSSNASFTLPCGSCVVLFLARCRLVSNLFFPLSSIVLMLHHRFLRLGFSGFMHATLPFAFIKFFFFLFFLFVCLCSCDPSCSVPCLITVDVLVFHALLFLLSSLFY
jgi:hypothetical protein